jgi:hypothetical protein
LSAAAGITIVNEKYWKHRRWNDGGMGKREKTFEGVEEGWRNRLNISVRMGSIPTLEIEIITLIAFFMSLLV